MWTFDGVMIDGFNSNATGFVDRQFHSATDEEIIAATDRILKNVRARVRDDFLNSGECKPNETDSLHRICQRHFHGNWTRSEWQLYSRRTTRD